MTPSQPHSSAVDHEHPSSIAERFVDGFMHPGLEHDAERLARGYQALEEQVEATRIERDDARRTSDDLLAHCDVLREQLEAKERELQDATRVVAALVYRTNKTSGVLLYPNDLRENLTLSRYDNPMAKTVHLFASNPASEPPSPDPRLVKRLSADGTQLT